MLKKIIICLLLATTIGLFPLTNLSTAAEKTKKAPASVQPAQSSVPTVNSITQAAVNAGVLTCTGRINQVANFLSAGSQGVGAIMFLPPNNPDQQMISTSMEIPLKDTSSAYATASFAPDQANGCTGMYETVVYWPQKCTEVAENNFGAFKKIGLLSKNIYVRDDGISTKVFLMPAGKGCVTIKKELIR
jgi:hypothetical protein